MLVATFGPTTGWVGKTITFENGAFVLQDHGPISANDVMQYDKQGHLVWANDQARALVEAKAQGAVAPAPVAPVTQPTVAPATVGDASLPSAAQPTARAKPKKTKKKASTRQTVFGCLTIVVIVLVIVAVVVAVTSGHKTPVAQQARDYIAKYKPDIVMVQGNVQTVQADMTAKGSLDQTAQDAQGVHDTLDKIRDNFVTTDTSGALGNDETEVFGAVNDLKNAMGALVTYTGTPNPATLAQFKSQYQTAVGEWDNGIDGIWQLAGTPTAAMKAAGLATPPTL